MTLSTSSLIQFASGSALGTAPGNVASLFYYRTNDTAATVEGANYFDGAVDYLKTGDMILAVVDEDGTPDAKFYFVTVSGTTVTIPAVIG